MRTRTGSAAPDVANVQRVSYLYLRPTLQEVPQANQMELNDPLESQTNHLLPPQTLQILFSSLIVPLLKQLIILFLFSLSLPMQTMIVQLELFSNVFSIAALPPGVLQTQNILQYKPVLVQSSLGIPLFS